MPSPAADHFRVEDNGLGLRLDSWKEIATYLCRGERTVKRWEVERGLPVRRGPGAGRAIVYAYTVELDEWLNSSNDKLTDSPDTNRELDPSSASPTAHSDPASTVGHLPAPEVSLPTPADSRSLQHRKIVNFSRGQKWSFAACCLLATGVAVGASARALYRGARSGGTTPAQSKSNPNSRAPGTVSDSEKQMAHELYLKGRFEWNKRTPESLERALDDFTEAIVHDPASAPSYSGLSDTYVLMHEYSSLRERDTYARAIAASKKAVQLDDSLAEAHRSLAFAELWGSWDFVDSDKQFRRAIELDPQSSLTHLWFATAFEGMPGWRAVVLREFDRAQELDPSSPVILSNKGIWLFEVGERKAGFDLVRQVERDNPDFVAPHRYLAMMYWRLRDYPDFLAENEKAASLKHDDILMEVTHAALSGFRRDGERGLLASIYLARKKFDLKGDEVGPSLVEICLRLGKRDEAIQLLQNEFDNRKALIGVLLISDIDLLNSDPRYRQLLTKIDLSRAPAPVP